MVMCELLSTEACIRTLWGG